MARFLLAAFVLLTGLLAPSPAATTPDPLPPSGLFSRTNLVAWCIVPFDSLRRTPEQRAAMLQSLGIRRFAYDWRQEHIPTFDREIEELARRGIQLTAWWFPAALNSDARAILDALARHRVSPQLWITLGTEPEPDREALERKIAAAATTLAPICTEAAKIGSTVGLYNHLGWFGEPTNQLAVLARLRHAGHTNAGIVYNFHHAHDQVDRFPELLRAMQPHLLAVNLNGMVPHGDRLGKKILPVGSGDLESEMLQTLLRSGWRGAIGILGHTDEDAEVKLRKELAGLEKLAPRLSDRDSTPTRSSAPPVNRDEPWKQAENDWVDDRRNLTVPSRWQAYSIPTPTGTVPKGLAVRVGPDQEATVCYDTATGNWRAAWTGGFLRFDPARFGLINAPRPDGFVHLGLDQNLGWRGGPFKWHGFGVVGERVQLEYSVGDLLVRESPWAATVDGRVTLARDLEIGPSTSVRPTLTILTGPGTRAVEGDVNRSPWYGFQDGDDLLAVLLDLQRGLQILKSTPGQIDLIVEPRDRPIRLRLLYHYGSRQDIDSILASVPKLGRFPNFNPAPTDPGAPALAPVTVRGQTGSPRDAYAIDTIPVPYENPAKALMFCSGVGFFDDGDAAVSTIHGDVWRVSGLDDSLEKVTWRRIASGLYQPLGLTVVSNQAVVLCRDHLLRLHDRDGDGVADRYEAFSSLIDTSASGHDYVTSLCRDDSGQFYYVDPSGAHRLSPDGRQRSTIAGGFRNPNGMGVSPDGKIVLVAPQQGSWTPSSVIHEIRQEGWYGYGGPKTAPARPLGYDLPLCWIPHRIDNSSGSQIWAPNDRFGPLSGQILHLSWGRCTMLLTLRDVVDGTAQGAVFPLKGRFISGPMRAAFRPQDGQMYVVGCQGWQTAAARDGSFQRVRWTGKPLVLPTSWRASTGQLRLAFNHPLDRESAEDADSYSLVAWNYRYSPDYGSKDWSVAEPDREGHDVWKVRSARLSPDGKSVALDVPELSPVMQFSLVFNLDAAGNLPAAGELYGTIHRVQPR